MGIVGHGVDVVSISRIAALVKRQTYDRLAKRILSPAELPQWQAISPEEHARRTRFLAVRWSVKEAVYKALYPVRQPTWKQFSFINSDSPKPMLIYHTAADELQKYSFHASVSHDGDVVFASVIVETTRAT